MCTLIYFRSNICKTTKSSYLYSDDTCNIEALLLITVAKSLVSLNYLSPAFSLISYLKTVQYVKILPIVFIYKMLLKKNNVLQGIG